MVRIELDPIKEQETYKEKPYLVGLYDIRKVYPQVDGLLERLENFDHYTLQHSLRAEAFAWNLATELEFEEEDRRTFCLAALLHDVGKLRLAIALINKYPFKKEDIEKIKPHVAASFRELYTICPDAAEIVLRHHSFQKDSYPSDEEISRLSKIDDPVKLSKIEKMAELLSMVDVFETRSGERFGKDPEPLKKFLSDLRTQFGSSDDEKMIIILAKILGKEKIIKRLHPKMKELSNLYLRQDIRAVSEISGDIFEADDTITEVYGYYPIERRRLNLLDSLSENEKNRLGEINQEVFELESSLKSLPEVSRLKELMQLGGTAERAFHSRFDHSELLAEQVKFAGIKAGLSNDKIKEMIAAAWLHDIGHSALSHVSDVVLEKYKFGNHEQRGVKAIEDVRGSISKVLVAHGVDPKNVSEIINEKGYLGKLQSIFDTLSYLVIDSDIVKRPLYKNQGAELISDLRRIDKEKELIVIGTLEKWQQLLENRAIMMRDIYLHPDNRRNRAATRVLLEIAAKKKLLLFEKVIKGNDEDIEMNLQSLVQFDPGAAFLAGKTGNFPFLEEYKDIWGLRYGPIDSDEWEVKMFETKGKMFEYLSEVIPQDLIMEALEQTVIVSPFDYTRKEITVLPEGSENPVTLKAKGVELRKEDIQYTVYIPRKFMKEYYAEKK